MRANGGVCRRNGRQPSAPSRRNRKIELERRLAALSGREDKAWSQVEAIAEGKRSAEYDQAAAVLKDLHTLAQRNRRTAEFTSRLERLRASHRRKLGLLDQLRSAGL